MKDIYLLSPWCERAYYTPQNSLLYIKYYLADHGYVSKIVDCSHGDREYDGVISSLKRSGNPIVGITAYTRERFHAYRLIRRIKQEVPQSFVVTGGRHFGFLAEETLTHMPEVDVVVRGEGEITMKEVCDAVCCGATMKDVLGISFRLDNQVCHNPDRPLFDDLDTLRCFDSNDSEEINTQKITDETKMDARRKYFSVMATRGCPNRCIYCSLTSSRVRYRSVDSVLKEIKEKIEITGVRNVNFTDASLTINRHYVEELCTKIIEQNLDIRFKCYSRVNINPELLGLMKNAGLAYVEIGLETGSPRILKSIRKNIRIEEFRRFCKMAYDFGIRVYVFCMVSLPDERVEYTEMTLSLIKDVSKYITYVGVQVTRILPDAALYGLAKDRNLLPAGFDWFSPYEIPSEQLSIAKDPFYNSIPIYLEHMSVKEIETKLDEFRRVIDSSLSNFDALKKAVSYNLSREGLKRLSIGNIRRKATRLLSMSYHTFRNRKKEANYEEQRV